VKRAIAMGERHGLFLVLALAVSAKEAMRLVVQAPFQRSLWCGLLVRPMRRALQRSESCGRRCSCCFSVWWARSWWRWLGLFRGAGCPWVLRGLGKGICISNVGLSRVLGREGIGR
jgi:hypothetical protein